jgi:hypothetical protein
VPSLWKLSAPPVEVVAEPPRLVAAPVVVLIVTATSVDGAQPYRTPAELKAMSLTTIPSAPTLVAVPVSGSIVNRWFGSDVDPGLEAAKRTLSLGRNASAVRAWPVAPIEDGAAVPLLSV